jgi:hypothetical protein
MKSYVLVETHLNLIITFNDIKTAPILAQFSFFVSLFIERCCLGLSALLGRMRDLRDLLGWLLRLQLVLLLYLKRVQRKRPQLACWWRQKLLVLQRCRLLQAYSWRRQLVLCQRLGRFRSY